MCLALALILAYGLFESLWTERWFTIPELKQAQSKIATIPRSIGLWEGEDQELDPQQIRQGDIRASLLRIYTDSTTGAQVNVLIVAGRSGPITVHAPEVCLGGTGFTLKTPAQRTDLSDEDSFWRGEFDKTDGPIPEKIEMFWSWNPGRGWLAVTRPRWTFARERYLYKLYVSRRVSGQDKPASSAGEDEGPIPGFLRQFLPEVQKALFSSEE
jgi:hypothetical protein